MNKNIFFIPLIVMISVSEFTFANEKPVELKKGCIKDHPLVLNETDQELLNIYSQICDKKNKKNIALQNELSIQAAQRYQVLGKNLKALQLTESLGQKGIQRTALTDISFLAGIGIAESSLQHMRSHEMRYLSAASTYPPAQQLSENIRASLPEPDTSDVKVITKNNLKQRYSAKLTSNREYSSHHSKNKVPRISRTKNINAQAMAVKAPATTSLKTQSNATASGSSPFASFNKN